MRTLDEIGDGDVLQRAELLAYLGGDNDVELTRDNCGEECPMTAWVCTRPKGHTGKHLATQTGRLCSQTPGNPENPSMTSPGVAPTQVCDAPH